MSTTEVLERLAHIVFALALLLILTLLAGYTIDPPPASAGPPAVSAPPPHEAVLDAALDLKPRVAPSKLADLGATCDSH